jgi:hypothetical protein
VTGAVSVSQRHRPSAAPVARDDAKHPAESVFFAFAYNAAGIPIAAGVLYPAFGLLLRRSSLRQRWRCHRSAWWATR